jgi:hypothetical protein
MDDGLLAEAKRHALETGRSLTRLIQDAVIALLERERGARSPRPVSLPVFGGDGLHPGSDIDDSSALLDAMEGIGENRS